MALGKIEDFNLWFSGSTGRHPTISRSVNMLIYPLINQLRPACQDNCQDCLSLSGTYDQLINEKVAVICDNIKQLFAEGKVNIGEYNLPSQSRGKYSPIFTEPEANNCFSVIFSGEYQESAKQWAKTR